MFIAQGRNRLQFDNNFSVANEIGPVELFQPLTLIGKMQFRLFITGNTRILELKSQCFLVNSL